MKADECLNITTFSRNQCPSIDSLIIDKLDWDDGDALEDSSYGRFPDGEVDAMTLTPTPGAESEW